MPTQKLLTPTGYPQRVLEGTQEQSLIDAFLEHGYSVHSGQAQTAQYIINYCFDHDIKANVEIVRRGGDPSGVRVYKQGMPAMEVPEMDGVEVETHDIGHFAPPKVRILHDDPIGRYKAGEVGTLRPHDFEKYDYLVRFPGTVTLPPILGRSEPIQAVRCYYFDAPNVELLVPTPEQRSQKRRLK